jgi:hypothetical protein
MHGYSMCLRAVTSTDKDKNPTQNEILIIYKLKIPFLSLIHKRRCLLKNNGNGFSDKNWKNGLLFKVIEEFFVIDISRE